MKYFTLECCVDSVESALAASQGGATRLELCADLPLGGTTPGISLFRRVRRHCALPIHVLLRPRFGDFCYTEHEMGILEDDAALFAEEGADAVVIGGLCPDGGLDTEAMARLMSAAKGCNVTLHRAFDLCRDPFETLEQAVELGVRTVLTSGQQASALEGAALLSRLKQAAAGRVEIMAGAGVSPYNIAALHKAAGLTAYHMSGKQSLPSPMIYRKEGVPMGLPGMSEYDLWRTDSHQVAAVRQFLRQAPETSSGGIL